MPCQPESQDGASNELRVVGDPLLLVGQESEQWYRGSRSCLEQRQVRYAEGHSPKGHVLDSPDAKCLTRQVCKKDELTHTGALGCPCAGIAWCSTLGSRYGTLQFYFPFRGSLLSERYKLLTSRGRE